MDFRTAALLLATALVAAACAHSDVRQHAAVDPDAKTISVPPPKRGLLKGLADALRADGWKLAAEQATAPKAAAPTKERGTTTDRKSAPATATRESGARYRLTVSARQIERCRSGGPLYIYDLVIADNRGGAKVLEQSGRDCERDIVEKFAEALRAKTK